MTPRLIKTESEHQAALAYVAKLMDATPGSEAEAKLEVWSLLIEKFEEERFPIKRPDPIAAIQFRMEQQGLTQSDLLEFIPSKSKVSEVLAGKRPLSLQMIRALHIGLHIPAEVLVQELRAPGSSVLKPKRGIRAASPRKAKKSLLNA